MALAACAGTKSRVESTASESHRVEEGAPFLLGDSAVRTSEAEAERAPRAAPSGGPTEASPEPTASDACDPTVDVPPRAAFDSGDQGCLVEYGDWDAVLRQAQQRWMPAFGPECATAELHSCAAACDAGDLVACVSLVNARLRNVSVSLSHVVDPVRDGCADAAADACHALGQIVLYGLEGLARNRGEAFVYHTWACEFGQGASCAIAGHMHRNGGDDIDRDIDRGYDLLRRGCQLGSPTACNDYGYSMVADTWGKPRDPERALRLFIFSCAHGSAYGCSSLGEALEHGWGTPRDPIWARRFWALQCTKDRHPEACAAVDRIAAESTTAR